jgi:hypothetical protein
LEFVLFLIYSVCLSNSKPLDIELVKVIYPFFDQGTDLFSGVWAELVLSCDVSCYLVRIIVACAGNGYVHLAEIEVDPDHISSLLHLTILTTGITARTFHVPLCQLPLHYLFPEPLIGLFHVVVLHTLSNFLGKLEFDHLHHFDHNLSFFILARHTLSKRTVGVF